ENKAGEIIRVSIDWMLQHSFTEPLSGLFDELKINERTLQRLFKKYVGISPGQFRRICQFQSAFEQIRNKQFERLSDVAYEQNYADQSHFIRSFREFTEKSPGEYLKYGL